MSTLRTDNGALRTKAEEADSATRRAQFQLVRLALLSCMLLQRLRVIVFFFVCYGCCFPQQSVLMEAGIRHGRGAQ
jgi:hypothetical protein